MTERGKNLYVRIYWHFKCRTVQEKLEVLREINQNMDDELLTSIELSLDIISEKTTQWKRRLDLVELNLKKRAQFENSRLRGK